MTRVLFFSMRKINVMGLQLRKPTMSVFNALAYHRVPVNILESVSLLPPVFQALRVFARRNQAIPSDAQLTELFDCFNEGGFYKLWPFGMFRQFVEFHCLVNPATHNQWYKVRYKF